MFNSMLISALVCFMSTVYFSWNIGKKKAMFSCLLAIFMGGIYGGLVVPEIVFTSYSFPVLVLLGFLISYMNGTQLTKEYNTLGILAVCILVVWGVCDLCKGHNKPIFYINDPYHVSQVLKVDDDLAIDSIEISLNRTGDLYKKYQIVGDVNLQRLNTTIYSLNLKSEEKELTFNNECYWQVLLENTEQGSFDLSPKNRFAYALVSTQDAKKVFFVAGLYDPETNKKMLFRAPSNTFFNVYRTYLHFKWDDRYANYTQKEKALKLDKKGNPFFVVLKVEDFNNYLSVLAVDIQDGKIYEYYTDNLPNWLDAPDEKKED